MNKELAEGHRITNNHINASATETKTGASNRSTNAKAAQIQPTPKALASVLLSIGRLRHSA